MDFIIGMQNQAIKVFISYLVKSDLKLTSQRKTIVEVFLETEGHFSAEELFHIVQKRVTEIGQATVYRTLKLLVKSGLADTLDFGCGVALYEHAYGHKHHDHLICVKCGKKKEFVDESIERRQESLARKNGFTLTRHKMNLYGICFDCQSREE